MTNVKEGNIVFLTISSFIGTSVGAQHFYGRLTPLEGDQEFDVKYRLSKEDAEHINKFSFATKEFRESIGYEEGELCSRFRSRKKVIAEAKKQFKKDFPKATVLVLGRSYVVEPQEILVGPRRFKTKINRLAKRAKEINYWDSEEEMQELCDKWQELWPEKYI